MLFLHIEELVLKLAKVTEKILGHCYHYATMVWAWYGIPWSLYLIRCGLEQYNKVSVVCLTDVSWARWLLLHDVFNYMCSIFLNFLNLLKLILKLKLCVWYQRVKVGTPFSGWIFFYQKKYSTMKNNFFRLVSWSIATSEDWSWKTMGNQKLG